MKATHNSVAKIERAAEKEREEQETKNRMRIKENREMRELLAKREAHKKKRKEEEERKQKEAEQARIWTIGEADRKVAADKVWRLKQQELYRERTMRGYCSSFAPDSHLVGNTPSFAATTEL